MLPPVPHSRRSSYSLSLPQRLSTSQREDDRLLDELDGLNELAELDAHKDDDALEANKAEGERGLEETLERMGMGRYQWWLLALCGCGWMADNSALQCVAVILPRVQIHYDLSTRAAGFLSASTMAGMMLGSITWGILSDLLGRALPFNTTLVLTSIFGIAASFSPSFPVLCAWMFALGSAVGGSMPTDGTLFLENLPHSKQYLLTLLSVFFSLGAVISSVVSMVALPGHSCQRFEGCDIAGGANDGWRRVLLFLGLINLCAAAARLLLFRLHESPRYLASNGRIDDAVVALRAIGNFNAERSGAAGIEIERADVIDTPLDASAYGVDDGPERCGAATHSTRRSRSETSPRSSFHALRLPSQDVARSPATRPRDREREQGRTHTHTTSHARTGSFASRASSTLEDAGSWATAWRAQLGKLFAPQWRRTVVLMWLIWASMSFAYTMFNVWLPAVLETRAGDGDDAIRRALVDFVLYSVAGCPGSVVGAYMIQTRLGRRRSLAVCTAVTALSMFAFMRARADWAVVVSSMAISAAATAMYAVLYGMTPETFGTGIRGTACGTSAALSRLTGICAPVVAGTLLALSPALPVFASAAIFALTAGCALLLPFERAAGPAGRPGAFAH
ncbi:hypothetical protein Q5752_001218 [Cryptotrichosporon argae]